MRIQENDKICLVSKTDICLVQHGLLTCEWSLQPEVDATDRPIASSGAGTALSLMKQVASLLSVSWDQGTQPHAFATVPCV